MLVAIHQPNFLPWLGYFLKIARADRFLFLDDAALTRTGGSYVNRVRLPEAGRPVWRTVPVARPRGGAPLIRDARIDDSRPWRRKFLAALRALYGRAPFFGEVYPFLEERLRSAETRLGPFNETTIRLLASRLGLPGERFGRASDFGVDATGTGRLVRLVRAAGGDAYLCGRGSAGYQDDAVFAAAGIRVIRPAEAPPDYPRAVPCEPPGGLSVVDALMALGFAGTARLLARVR